MPDYAQPSLLAGAKSPEKLRVMILVGTLDIDLRTVDTVVLKVERPLADPQSWLTTIESVTRDAIRAVHTFDADGFETREPGRYRVTPILTLKNGAGVRRAKPFYLPVEA